MHHTNTLQAVIVGAGLVGLNIAIQLARAGFEVHVHEARSAASARQFDSTVGRQISVDLSARGVRSLTTLGLWPTIRACARRVVRRRIHTRSETLTVPFGDPDKAIYVADRGGLRTSLLDLALNTPNLSVFWSSRLETVDESLNAIEFKRCGVVRRYPSASTLTLGCDGVRSTVRSAIERSTGQHFEITRCPWALIPVVFESAELDPRAMHLWARGTNVFVAQPTPDERFAGGLLTQSADPNTHLEWWAREMRDMPSDGSKILAQLAARAPVQIQTVQGGRWRAQRSPMLVLGDAAHAMTPFMGQGANCAFESCDVLAQLLAQLLDEHAPNIHAALEAFEAVRRPAVHAARELSLNNYPELCAHRRANASRRRQIEATLAATPTYETAHQLVCFTQTTYPQALARWVEQEALINAQLGANP